MYKFNIGDRIVWMRAGKMEMATVLGVVKDRDGFALRVSLQVDGWSSTTWEPVSYSMKLWQEKEPQE